MNPTIFEKDQPALSTARLQLRAFTFADAARVQRLANVEAIADVTANLPFPYPDGLAENWIGTHPEKWRAGEQASYAITLNDSGELIGCISLVNIEGASAETGYWLGLDYWGRGYISEACRALLDFGFIQLRLNLVRARVLERNPASVRVLVKCGFKQVGREIQKCGYRQDDEDCLLFEKKSEDSSFQE